MVLPKVSQVSHFAPSFRPQQPTFSFTRNAFPPAPPPPGPSAYGSPHAVGGRDSQAPGAGASGAGGAGAGGRWNAGNRNNWSFQHTRMSALPPANPDPNSRPNDEDDRELSSHRLHRTPSSTHSHTLASQSLRRHSATSERPPVDQLLNADEAGLSGVRLASVEMQERYRLAFSRGEKTPEVREMEIEADEMDLGPRRVEATSPRGRRASFSSPAIGIAASGPSGPLLSSSPSASRPAQFQQQQQRAIHSSSSAAAADAPSSSSPSPSRFPLNASPPYASIPRVRRNSTSAVDVAPPPTASSPPIADLSAYAQTAPVRHTQKARRPTNSTPADSKLPYWKAPVHSHAANEIGVHPSPDALERHRAIALARSEGSTAGVRDAVRAYQAFKKTYSTASHNLAMEAILDTRQLGTDIAAVLKLYNELFDTDGLRPNTASYNAVLRAFALKDKENCDNLRMIENRVKKRQASDAALGPWGHSGSDQADRDWLDGNERKAVASIEVEDYFTPALKIYTSLGRAADQLSLYVVNQLLARAVFHKRVDVAIALFSRLEKSPVFSPNRTSYDLLLMLYGGEKDPEGVLDVFEAYLAARANGLRKDIARPAGSITRGPSTKHRYTTDPQWVKLQPGSQELVDGDTKAWATAIEALFTAGDAVGGVALLERLLAAQVSGERLPVGYPAEVETPIHTAVITGFLLVGDVESASRWFDKVIADSTMATSPSIIRKLFFLASEKRSVDFINRVYRRILRDARDRHLSVGEFVVVIDDNLAAFHQATDPVVRNSILDTVLEFRTAFEAACEAGLGDGAVEKDDGVSTGFHARIIYALGATGRYDDALVNAIEFIGSVDAAMSRPRSSRTPAQWVHKIQDVLPAALGFDPIRRSDGPVVDYVFPAGKARPSLDQVVTAVTAASKVFDRVEGWNVQKSVEFFLVETYVTRRIAAQGDFASLNLSREQWFTVIRSFAGVAARQANGLVPTFDFPGFEPIIDDFYASGLKFSEDNDNNYGALARSLRQSGMAKGRIAAVVSILDPWVAEALSSGEVDVWGTHAAAAAAKAAAASLETPSSPAPVSQAGAASVELETESVAESVASPSVFRSSESAATLPSPPSTPPTYFADLPQPPPSDVFPEARQINDELSNAIEARLYKNHTDAAYQLAVDEATQNGQFAHPESLGHLVELLGREGKIDSVRHTYLIAYEALGLLADGPEAQALAWTQLEDKMIIALAQAGVLEEVAVHRLRLLHAGSAPSADAYAAMILNMKETTNDAAVALELFEESQRHGVPANVYLFNTLISKLSRARRAREALEYFELMKEAGIRPTSITYGAVINACCKTGDDVSAELLFKEMVQSNGFKPRVPPYNTMIQFYTQTKPDRTRALAFYDQMVKAGVHPTGHTYKLLLDAYGSVGEPDAPAMSAVFDKLVADKAVTVNGSHWASLINSWGCVQKNLDVARSIFASIESHRSTAQSKERLPDAVAYEALLNACIANGKPDLCDEYLEEMRVKGVHMTAYVANTLMKAHATQNNILAVRNVFEAMEDPPVGVAAAGNHPVARHPKHHHQAGEVAPPSPYAPVYREPSSWEIMVRSELAAGEMARAAALLTRLEDRAFPEAVVNRIRKLLTEHGLDPADPVVATTLTDAREATSTPGAESPISSY